MKLKLKLMNDPALRVVCTPVEESEIADILFYKEEMARLMKSEQGLALAANQVGFTKRFFLLQLEEGSVMVFNPEIVEMTGLITYEEGCLSIPGASAKTQRYKNIIFKAKDETFKDVTYKLSGIEAIAVQHEIDHLDGKLYIDALSPMQKMLVNKNFRSYLNSLVRRNR